MFLLFGILFVSACAGPAQKNMEARAGTDARLSKAADALQSGDFKHIFLPAKGIGAEALSEASLKSGAGTSTSRALAEQIISAKADAQKIVVTGANDAIAALTLIDALTRMKDTKLLSVSIAYVGASGYEADMRKAADISGVKLFYLVSP